ncbi:L-proline trans-4-hydroxylase-like [Ruditapes philippinarum]|uniref:L-proline trans-4-hydroxylase-like n=1 Tax=Ruditapes philippinarum TaxID=129788 RepID=UPI00295ACFDA|nr:L-proline trans-4-hydroxylase-like [Ruditapes philippinarum]
MPLKKYECIDGEFCVTDEIKAAFEKDGFIIAKGLLSQEEIAHVEKALKTGPFEDHTYGVGDGAGKEAHLIMWNHPGVDVTGMVGRCEKVAGTCEKLLGGEVYHYHTKLMKKPAKIGGRHVWHQDYGYWYRYGNLFPNMMTVFIAVDKATKENGCLQVLKGSHKCGRIDHITVDGQQGADMERVEEIAKQLPLEYVELERGDALFFHCNLLHCSSANTSPSRRWAFLCAYNRADNNPVKVHFHPFYTPLEKVPNSAILECQDFTTLDGKWFNDPITDNIPTGRRISQNGQ